MKAVILHKSKTGTTKKYADEIGRYLNSMNISSTVSSIDSYDSFNIASSDIIMLGCWTSGLFFFGQHPEKAWVDFAKKLPDLKGKKILLFTTYKMATGSMFKNMKKYLNAEVVGEIKSRNGLLSEQNKNILTSL